MQNSRVVRFATAVLLLSVAYGAQAQRTTANANANASGNAMSNRPENGIDLSVPVRGQYILNLAAPPSRLAIGDPEVADVKLLSGVGGRGGQIMVYGKKPGLTQLQVWIRGGTAPQVYAVRVMSDMQQVLAARGEVGASNVDMAGPQAMISGQFDSAETHNNAVQAARAAAGKNGVVDVSTVNTSSTVQVEVKVVEVERSTIKNIGLNANFDNGTWTIGAPFGTLAGGLTNLNSFGIGYASSKVTASLNLLETDGLARVLAEPTLLAQSGQSASFLAGGELPIPQSGGLGTVSVVYKPFGVGLTVTPTVMAKDRIAIKVAPEASELDPTNGVTISNGGGSSTFIPALRTRKADTTVELGDGETFIISGLVSRQTKAQVNKVPFLGNLPIIGAFFRGIQYSQDDRELVFVVTPRLVRPLAKGVALPLPGAREEQSNLAGTAWGYYLMGPMSGDQMPGFSK